MNSEKSTQSPLASSFSQLIKEPLVHFIVLATLLFAANEMVAADSREPLVVDRMTQEYLFKMEQSMKMHNLTGDEKDAIVEKFVQEEILVREARKLGLDNSGQIRKLLQQNMRFFFKEDMPKASDEALFKFYTEHNNRFTSPTISNFDQVFYIEKESIPQDLMEQLNAGADHREFGDVNPHFTYRLTHVPDRELIATFGQEAAKKLMDTENPQWYGPIESDSGWHYLRLNARKIGQAPAFETIKPWVQAQWESYEQSQIMRKVIEDARENYAIHVMPTSEGDNKEAE
ncbi:peptidyl-prolyl cis-trans isomerase [Paraferrimonas sedimenticola]|uniref:PpiC domain-containing protein n=1 Tax=Paraferrimonas sedimenticola TaxID=375674 RepID=A0AA37W0U6_9GAMM|nr:peptidylprolyl isomerase [Paraferrimonas sedimenticola]GLP96043.1 hypothetical protein GCM10007895_13490 [Paraferrimonas sedimenticola]